MANGPSTFGFEKSELRRKLFLYFFTNPDRRHYLREIAELIKVDPTNLSRELKRREAEGIFLSEISGHQKYFSLNRSFQLYNEIKSTVHKTIGVPETLKSVLVNIPGIKRAFIYGSFAKGSEKGHSDIDVCLIIKKPEFSESPVLEGFHRLESELGREIFYLFFTEQEWGLKQMKKDCFVLGILKGKRIDLINERN